MNKVIQKAIEGGYNTGYFLNGRPFSLGESEIKDFFLDPLFWQALGKQQGWREDKSKVSVETDLGELHTRVVYGGYLSYWHQFIDHLASGKDADSFFNELLK